MWEGKCEGKGKSNSKDEGEAEAEDGGEDEDEGICQCYAPDSSYWHKQRTDYFAFKNSFYVLIYNRRFEFQKFVCFLSPSRKIFRKKNHVAIENKKKLR